MNKAGIEMSDIVERIKTKLRVSIDDFDKDDIEPLIEACKLDLKNGGVTKINEEDQLIYQAISLYCRAYFDANNVRADFAAAYESLKNSLAISEAYGGKNSGS